MSFEAHITKMDERPVPKLWLAKPDFTIIERINGVSNLSAKMNYMNENEISFDVNSHLFDEFTNEQYRNPTIEKMRNKYLIKMTYNKQTEWFIIENFSKTSGDKDYVPTTAKHIGSELDKKWVGDIEEIGVTPAQLFNKFLPAVAPNWSIRSIDEKIANVKREYTTSDASISTLIEEVCKAIDAVVVFHNRDRQFSLVHRDNAGKFKGLKVKEATYLKGFTDEQNSENLTTRLVLFGKDGLTINGVNPAGTDYIEDFSYYMKPFRRDSERNVLEHSDYMSDALCHALLDFEEYFNNKTDEYEKLSEQYTNILKEQLEEEFKLTEITAIKQRLEDRVELLKPQGNYIEKRILGNTSFDFKYNTRYIMVIQNNGTTAKLTLNGEEQIVAGGQSTYFKVHTPPQATLDDPQIRHTLQVLSATPNLMASLSTASEDDFAEEDVLEIEKKFNIYKYRELYNYQVGILAAVERKIKEYDNQRQSINHSLAVDTFFPPALVKERENFINWGVWREEDHTDAKELLKDGLKQLKEHNNVERTVTVSLIDFIQSLEDKDNWDKLSAGDKIQFSNKIYDANMEAFISELNINFDSHDVSVTLSNIIDLQDRSRGIAQKMASFVSTAGKVNMQKSQLEDQLHKSNQVIALLEGEWDANKRRITAANETVSIDNRGIIVTSPSHPNEMLVAVAGVIAISNDGGETFKQAINTRGVVAERLIGKVLIGTELVMENDAGTFRFDNEGFRINASNFHLIADDGEDYFDTLMRRLQQEIVTAEEKISEEIKQQGESLKSEINDVDQSLMDYTAGLINALADGLLTEQEIHSLKLQLNMLEADYSQVARRVRPILFDSALDPVIQEELYVSYYRLDEDYQTLVSFIRSLEEPTEVPQETIDNIITLLKRFKPAIEELVAMIETSLTNTQRNRIANAEYNSNTFAENLANDLNDEISDLNDSLKGLNDSLEDALTDGIITTVEQSQLSDALMRFESEKQDVDNRFHNTYNHAHIVGTANQVSLQQAKSDYNNTYSRLIAKVKQILNMSSVSHAIVEEYKALYQEFTTAVVAYSEEYERAVEFIQKGYADTAEGEAKKYTDGLRIEVEADVKDIQDNIVEFETDVYGAFKDGIITEQERNRLGIHHDMLEKEKSDLIERYDTIITSDYLQGFYDVEQLVATRSLYGQVHADLLLALELAMMDSKITKEESQEATRLFDLYVQRLTQFSKELELAIAALGESKAVAHTNEQLNNYMSLSVFNDEIAMLQAEIDGHIMTWYYNHEPTLSTLPASEWTDDKTRNAHVGDLFYHETEGHAFRFMRKSGGGYEWQLIKDTEVTKALSDAQNALDLADDKRRVFVAQPTPPYDIGDLWIKGDGELMRARVNKEGKTQFSDLDWVKATKYTDDTVANQVGNQLSNYKTANNREIQDLKDTLGSFRDTVEGAFKDGIVAEYELKILKTQMQSLDREKADVDAGYNQLLNHPNLTGAPKTKLQSAYTGFAETHNNLTAAINRVITDGIITESEYEEVMGLLDSYPIALTTYKNVMNETYLHLIKIAQDVADGALDIAGRLDTWKSSSFEVDSEKIATRVGESNWETKWQPVVEQGINDAVDGIEVGGRNLILNSDTQFDFEVKEAGGTHVLTSYAQDMGVAVTDDISNLGGKQITFSYEYKTENFRKTGSNYFMGFENRLNYDGGYTFGFRLMNPDLLENTDRWVKVSQTHTLENEEFTSKTGMTFLMRGAVGKVSIRRLKAEIGTVASDWTEAPEDTEARMAQTNKELKDVKDSLSTFENTITTSFKDGIIETAEAKAINSHKAQLSKEKKDIDQKYTTIYANTRLAGAAKTNLLAAKTAFNTSHSNLMSVIDKAISDGKATTAEYNTVISGFGDYEAKLATLTYRFEEANDYIGSAKATSAETNAKTHADTAAKNAKDAAEAYAKTKAEAERVLAEAHADGKVTAEEKARIADANAKLKEAKAHADTTSKDAEDAAKAYADTEISKIEIGGRNLIIDSDFKESSDRFTYQRLDLERNGIELIATNDIVSTTSYPRILYRPLGNLEVGKQYTISFKAKSGGEPFSADFWVSDASGGSRQITSQRPHYTEQWKKYEYTLTITGNFSDATAIQWWVNATNPTTKQTLHLKEFKMEIGNKATDWTPAPEDIESQFKTINSNAYGLNEELTKVFKDGIISEAEATAIGDSINLVKSDYENVMKRYTNVYANTGLVGTAKTNLLSARNAYNTSYNALVNHITAVISSGNITNTQRATYNTLFSDYRVKIGVLSDAIESAWDAIVNKKSGDAANSAVTGFYNTTIKSNYSTTTQTKELLGSYVTSTEMQGNLDKIATGYAEYDVSQTGWKSLKEVNGSSFNDGFSYEVTVRRKTSDDTLFVGIFNSRGKGKGWDREILEQKGSTSSHPEVYNTTTGDIRLRTYGSGSTKYAMEVVYTKYAGSFTNLSKTNSMIEQTAEAINSEVRKKVGNDEIISRINQSAEKISIDADRIELTAGSSIRLAIGDAVDGIEVGGRNLVLNSDEKIESSEYLVQVYNLSEDWQTNQEYTVVIKGEIDEGQRFGIWAAGTSTQATILDYDSKTDTYKSTFTLSSIRIQRIREFRIYNTPSGTGSAKVDYVMMVKGNKVPLGHIPAPEDINAHADAAAKAAETAAKTHADTAAKNAKDAAEAYAKTKAEAERVLAEAHADGKVTAEEKARIADVNAKLKEAKTHADSTANIAEKSAKDYADTEIGKIEVGGRNLLLGSGEPDALYFHTNNNTTSPIESGIEDGINWVTGRLASSGNFYLSLYNNPTFESGFNSTYSEPLHEYDGELSYSVDVMSAEPVAISLGGESVKLTPNKWTRLHRTNNSRSRPPGMSAHEQSDIPLGTKVYWRKYQIETGNMPTPWTPAPEDIDSGIKDAKDTADSKVAPSEIIPSINLDKSGARIEGKQIELIGDVNIVNGSTKLSNAIINTAHIDSLSFDVLKGGTALFGGNGNNGILEVRDEDDNSTFKMDSSQTAASHITIGELNVERINSPELVKYSSEDMVFFVRGSTYGDDSNDGLTLTTAFATFGRAIEEIPQIYDGVCEIRTRTVREYEEVEIKGFSGKGKVIIMGMNENGNASVGQLDTYAKFRILGNNIDVVLEKMHLYSDGGAVVQVDGASVSLKDINMTGNIDSHGLALSRNAFADWRVGEIFNVDRGVTVYYGSRAYLRDLTGRANGFGLVVAYASMADISNFGVTGDSVNSSVWDGSYMGGSTNYPSAPKPKPAPTPKPVTRVRTFKSSSTGHYYVGASWGWNNTYMTTYPFQGKWGSVHMKEGAWFFGSTMRNTLQGKTIKKIRVSIGRTAYGSQGYTGRRKFTLRMHSHSSRPSGRPNMTGTSGTYTGTLSLGERRWFDVTSVFSSFIRNGSWYGFGVKTTSTSDYEYMAMMKSMTVEVTYEE